MFPSRPVPQATIAPLPTLVFVLPFAILIFVLAVGSTVGAAVYSDYMARGQMAGATDAPQVESAPVAAGISPVFTPEVQYWGAKISEWSSHHQLDANLVATVMQIESCGNPAAKSGAGAQGLFQVMPFHFSDGEDMLDPDTNARRGLAYLAQGLTIADGKAGLALAGYNGGHSQIGKGWSLWPGETQRYYYWGSGIYNEALAGEQQSATLAEWLRAGGASLCASARKQLGLP